MKWRTLAEFFVSGEPLGQPRPRARIMKIGAGRAAKFIPQIYNPADADPWKRRVLSVAEKHAPPAPLDGPVRVDEIFYLPRPQRLYRRRDPDGPVVCTSRPDRDNLDKLILDALKTAGYFRDDAQVCDGYPRKLYHAKTGKPGAAVRVSVPADDAGLFEDGHE